MHNIYEALRKHNGIREIRSLLVLVLVINCFRSWAWVRDLREREVVSVYKVPGKENPADVLTKILSGPEYVKAERKLKGNRIEMIHLGS